MNILILNGSARKGNTYAAVHAFAEGAESKGNEVHILQTDLLNLAPCKGCNACECSKGCVANDETNTVVDQIVSSDIVLFASPVYWWGISAQLKLVIDKCFSKANLLKGKAVGIILTGEAATDDEEYSIIKSQFDCIAKYLNWKILFFKTFCAGNADELSKSQNVMTQLRTLGSEIQK